MKHRTGCLIRKGTSYSVRMVIDGTVIIRALKTPEGNPVRTLIEARRAQAVETKEMALLTRKEALEVAIRKLAETEEELATLRTPKPKLADLWESYLRSGERPNSGEGTLANYKRHIDQFSKWVNEHYPKAVHLQDVSKSVASEYGKHLAETYSPNTHNKNISFLRLMWRVLCDGGICPFDRIKFKPLTTTAHEALTQEQIEALLKLAKGETKTLLIIASYTALRRKDACLLKWEQVDMEKGFITVKPSKTASRSGKVISIPIHPVLKANLETTFRKSEYVLSDTAFWYKHDPTHISKQIKILLKQAGIKTQLEIEDKQGTKKHNKALFSMHSLRFSLAQRLVNSGTSIETIRQLLGHTSEAMSRHYSTVNQETKEKAIMSLPSMTITA